MVESTYGVGPTVAGKNVGPDNSTVSRLAQYGKVYDKNGDLVFDPTVNLIEQIDPESMSLYLTVVPDLFQTNNDESELQVFIAESEELMQLVLDTTEEQYTVEDAPPYGEIRTTFHQLDGFVTIYVSQEYLDYAEEDDSWPKGATGPKLEYSGYPATIVMGTGQYFVLDEGSELPEGTPPPEPENWIDFTIKAEVDFVDVEDGGVYGTDTYPPLDQSAYTFSGSSVEFISTSPPNVTVNFVKTP